VETVSQTKGGKAMCMNPRKLTPLEIKGRIFTLRKRLKNLKGDDPYLLSKTMGFLESIDLLQRMCDHSETVSRPFADGAKVKFVEVCTSCGLEGVKRKKVSR
jgi:hypothetical protein